MITDIKYFKRDEPCYLSAMQAKTSWGRYCCIKRSKFGWQHFASPFLTSFQQKYSINGWKLLAAVWAIENYQSFVYGTQFEVLSDHKAMTSIIKENRAHKKYSSWLTRRVDRLLPFHFTVTHAPGRTLGVTDYLSRHPSSPSNNNVQLKAEELWNYCFTVNKTKCEKIVSDEQITRGTANYLITAELAEISDLTDRRGVVSEKALSKQEKLTLKNIFASVCEPANSSLSAQPIR